MLIGGIREDAKFSYPIFNNHLIDLMIFEVFLYLNDTIELCETFLQILPWVNALLRKVLCIMY